MHHILDCLLYTSLASILHLPNYFKGEEQMTKKAMELLEVFDLDKYADVKASNLPYGKPVSYTHLGDSWFSPK